MLPSFNFDAMEPNSFDQFCLIDEDVRFLEVKTPSKTFYSYLSNSKV